MPALPRPRHICAPCLRRAFSTHPPRHAAPPPPPPSAGTTNLTPTRRLIALHGIDAPKYLQGVTTTNIPTLHTGSYSAFLTPQGRLLHDVFIFPTHHSPTWRRTASSDDPSYFIEVDAASASNLIAHIKRYKLRSKFTTRLLDPDEWASWALWDDRNHAVNLPHTGEEEISCADTRAPRFGKRVVVPDGRMPALETLEAEVPVCSAETYKLRRILHGVPEGQEELVEGVALPAESCVDYMGGVDFRKGCYVGQELTIRTQHRGVVRKRILPVALYKGAQAPPERLVYDPDVQVSAPEGGEEIRRVGRKGRAGKWLGGVGNVGLALCRLEMMTDVRVDPGATGGYQDGDEFVLGEGEGEVKVKAFVPGWHLLGNRAGNVQGEGGGAPLEES